MTFLDFIQTLSQFGVLATVSVFCIFILIMLMK